MPIRPANDMETPPRRRWFSTPFFPKFVELDPANSGAKGIFSVARSALIWQPSADYHSQSIPSNSSNLLTPTHPPKFAQRANRVPKVETDNAVPTPPIRPTSPVAKRFKIFYTAGYTSQWEEKE
ncbi:MAG: hypothetical protein Q4D62_09025, partial [Planctomycetia bacterium]|nr:hypothetical protein [Planctomycetia bacterium]